MIFRNVGSFIPVYTTSHSWRLESFSSTAVGISNIAVDPPFANHMLNLLMQCAPPPPPPPPPPAPAPRRQIPKSLRRMSARLAVAHLVQLLCGGLASIEAFILQRKPSDFDFTSFFVGCFGNANKREKRSWVMKPKQHYDYVNILLTLRRLMSYIYIYIYIWSTHSWCF